MIEERQAMHPALVLALGVLTGCVVVAAALLPSIAYIQLNHIDLLDTRAGSVSGAATAVPVADPKAAIASAKGTAAAPVRVPHWSDVRAIFADHCLGCHANLRSYAGTLKVGAIPAGGLLTDVKVIAPGDPAGSILLQALLGRPPLGEPMPYRAASLSRHEIDTIAKWISSGAQP
jgi:uncharacterized membrane protein